MSDQSNNTSDIEEESNVIIQEDDASEITDSLKTQVSSPYRRASIQLDTDDRPRKKQKFNFLRKLCPDMSEPEESTLGMSVDGISGDSDVVQPQTEEAMVADEVDGGCCPTHPLWPSSAAQKYRPQPTTSRSAEAACSSEVPSRDGDDQPSKVFHHCNPRVLVGSDIQIHQVEDDMSVESVPEDEIDGSRRPTPSPSQAVQRSTDRAAMSPFADVSDDDQTSDSSSKESRDFEQRQDPSKKVKMNPFNLRRARINPLNAVEMEDSPTPSQADSSNSELRRLEEPSNDIAGTSSASMTSSHLQQEFRENENSCPDPCLDSLRSILLVLNQCDNEMKKALEKLDGIIKTRNDMELRKSISFFLLLNVREDVKKFLTNLHEHAKQVKRDHRQVILGRTSFSSYL